MKKNSYNFKYNKPGITLIEVIVSTALFVVIMLAMTQIFKMMFDYQRQAIATQNVQENMKYFFEVISKEMRTAIRAGGGCDHLPANARFNVTEGTYGDILYLKNYHDECVTYSLADDNGVIRFKVERGDDSDYISPSKIDISDLSFIVNEDVGNQAFITVNMGAHSVGREAQYSQMYLQTTITSRYYRAN
ncbi:prepilin-type N-terminal cleavage/methylation domain-containing protein [Patescibacteria group bacterium]|nr:prepilin-type N-terminal cleavage/methylation domain-containing protein [Patescibacteria group bacterium]